MSYPGRLWRVVQAASISLLQVVAVLSVLLVIAFAIDGGFFAALIAGLTFPPVALMIGLSVIILFAAPLYAIVKERSFVSLALAVVLGSLPAALLFTPGANFDVPLLALVAGLYVSLRTHYSVHSSSVPIVGSNQPLHPDALTRAGERRR